MLHSRALFALATLSLSWSLATASESPSAISDNDDNAAIPQPTLAPRSFVSAFQCTAGNGGLDSCGTVDGLLERRDEGNGDGALHKRQEEEEDGQTSSRVVNVPQNAPNGGLSMTQPPITAQATVSCWPSMQ